MALSIFLPRILTALFLGSLIGIERDIYGRAAGLRTHMLVAVGSALFTMISLTLHNVHGTYGDPGRIAAQIVSGIGFLGAGTILKSGLFVRGLTTAACMWLAAALGMACGFGLLWQATLVGAGMLLILLLAKKFITIVRRVITFKLSIVSTSADMNHRVINYFKQRPDTSVKNAESTCDHDNNLYSITLMVDAMSSKGQPTLLQEFHREITGMNLDLKLLKIESFSAA
ncbi:MAG: MgtC/SapB family protein [Oligosphaeraceae bacterium]|nr:MgtC/SapB family protein [Oligosphaeraceae bacterium]